MSEHQENRDNLDKMTSEDMAEVERYMKLYQETLSNLAYLAKVCPDSDFIGQMRASLAWTAEHIQSNRPRTVEEFRDVAGDADAFLGKIQEGEIDAKDFMAEPSPKQKNDSA